MSWILSTGWRETAGTRGGYIHIATGCRGSENLGRGLSVLYSCHDEISCVHSMSNHKVYIYFGNLKVWYSGKSVESVSGW